MKIQVNSDKTIAVDARLMKFIEGEVRRILRRFTARLTRVEVHLSDVDNLKSRQADKRCLIEVRPAGGQPRTASARATEVGAAVDEASKKMQRALTTYFGRMDGSAAGISTPVAARKKPRPKKTPPKKVMSPKAVVSKAAGGTKKKAAVKKPATPALIVEHFTVPVVEPKNHREHSLAKKRIYQARRKAWPTR